MPFNRGTSNLYSHLKIKYNYTAQQIRDLQIKLTETRELPIITQNSRKRPRAFTVNENFDKEIYHKKILAFMVANNLSFQTITSPSFRDLLAYCRQ